MNQLAPQAPVNKGGRPPKYPLRSLAVGESVFLPGVTEKKINKVRKVYEPMKFRVKTFANGARIWRIA